MKSHSLLPQTNDVPHAVPGPLTAPFWDGCAQGVLLFQRCGKCAAAIFPPTSHCRECQSVELTWEQSTGHGTLYSWTVVSRPVTPAFVAPYAAAIVTLDEGYQMVTNVIDVDAGDLRIDLPVTVAFRSVGPVLHLPYFTPF
jgi:uncharacterized OB-fold protein